jgi:predicted CXXCH cytochrome family protein
MPAIFCVLFLLFSSSVLAAPQPCAKCHAAEVAGFARSAMSHALSAGATQPDGSFVHQPSGTTFTIHSDTGVMWQQYQRGTAASRQPIAYTIGSGSHAYGYLVQIGNHLFQSPISYYTKRHTWDMAPGYETATHPDFSRPVSEECLVCHSGKARPIANTLNQYQTKPFAAEGITCDRCHGPTAEHLKNPVPGSILNPARLTGATRDSVCEQCHLAGELRIPNPGKSIADFRPGQTLEETYTVYLGSQPPGAGIKVISQAEQLRLSTCSRSSAGKLWCGSCHNPHDQPSPENADAYYRERCLVCHGATLAKSHAAPGRDCVGCHMPQQPAKDGGHTAFTDHRIARFPSPEKDMQGATAVTAWRDPPVALRDRNLSLALITLGLQNSSAPQVIQGFRLLNQVANRFPNDPAALTSMATVLLRARQTTQALPRFEKALQLRPNYAPYEVNVAAALLESKQTEDAITHLKKALQLDPLLQQAVNLLVSVYHQQGDNQSATLVLRQYQRAMGITDTAPSSLPLPGSLAKP